MTRLTPEARRRAAAYRAACIRSARECTPVRIYRLASDDGTVAYALRSDSEEAPSAQLVDTVGLSWACGPRKPHEHAEGRRPRSGRVDRDALLGGVVLFLLAVLLWILWSTPCK